MQRTVQPKHMTMNMTRSSRQQKLFPRMIPRTTQTPTLLPPHRLLVMRLLETNEKNHHYHYPEWLATIKVMYKSPKCKKWPCPVSLILGTMMMMTTKKTTTKPSNQVKVVVVVVVVAVVVVVVVIPLLSQRPTTATMTHHHHYLTKQPNEETNGAHHLLLIRWRCHWDYPSVVLVLVLVL